MTEFDIQQIFTNSSPAITGAKINKRMAPPRANVNPSDIPGIGRLSHLSSDFKDPSMFIVTNETPTVMMILNKSDSKILNQTNKFLLQSITKPQQEKFQVIETFGKSHVFFYGERTRVYTIQGVLIDGLRQYESFSAVTENQHRTQFSNNWSTALQDFYNTELRGTLLKDRGHIAALYVNGWMIRGYPVQLTIAKESNNMPDAVTFQMTWVIEDEILLNRGIVRDMYKNPETGQVLDAQNIVNKLLYDYQELLNARNQIPISRVKGPGGSDELNVLIEGMEQKLKDAQNVLNRAVQQQLQSKRMSGK